MSDRQTMSLHDAVQGYAQAKQNADPAPEAGRPPVAPVPQGSPQDPPAVVAEDQQAEEDPQLPEAEEEGRPQDADPTEEEGSEPLEDGESEDDQDAEPTFTVEVDGENRELTASEIRDGLMLKADHTRKTMQLAEQRKATQAKQAEYEAGAERTLALMNTIVTTLAGNPVPQPDPNLFYTDKAAFETQNHAYQTWAGQVQQWQSAIQQFNTEHAEIKRKEMAEVAQKEAASFMKAFDIAEGDTAALLAKSSSLQQFVRENYPIPEEVVNSAVLHGFYLMAEDARIGREAKASANGKGKRSMKPRVKSVSSGKGNVRPRQVKESDKAVSRFEQTAQAMRDKAPGVRREDLLRDGAAALRARRSGN